MSQQNVELAKAFFDAYNARDSEAVDRLLHPDAEITTLTARAGLPYKWSPGATRRYFEQLDETLADRRVEIEDYRELGERVVALGVVRGAGISSQIEVGSEFAECSSSRTRDSCSSTPTTTAMPPSKPPGWGSRRGSRRVASAPGNANWPRRKPFASAPRLVRAMGAFGGLLGFGQL